MRSGPCSVSDSKAHREKIRRDKLNDRQAFSLSLSPSPQSPFLLSRWNNEMLTLFSSPRFQELSSLLDPERPPKLDKCVVLTDAARMVVQLRDEAEKLKESFESLQKKVDELKVRFCCLCFFN